MKFDEVIEFLKNKYEKILENKIETKDINESNQIRAIY